MIKKKNAIPFEQAIHDNQPQFSKFGQALIAIACVGFFPGVYFIGKWLISIL